MNKLTWNSPELIKYERESVDILKVKTGTEDALTGTGS